MTETPLIIIELSPRQDIGYTVKAGEMENRIIEKHRDDIIDTLLLLAEQLKAKRYPFGFLRDENAEYATDGDKNAQVVKAYKNQR